MSNQLQVEPLLYNAFSGLIKFAIASVAVGATLSAMDISAAEVLADLGVTPEQMRLLLSGAVDWALPHFILGAMVIVPIWLVLFLLKPPGFGK